jgi:hypothetical protein
MSFRYHVHVAVLAFGSANVVLMFAYGKSMLEPTPWIMLMLFLVTSVLGALLATPFWFTTRGWGLKVADWLVWQASLIGLALFNYWCILSASAAA